MPALADLGDDELRLVFERLMPWNQQSFASSSRALHRVGAEIDVHLRGVFHALAQALDSCHPGAEFTLETIGVPLMIPAPSAAVRVMKLSSTFAYEDWEHEVRGFDSVRSLVMFLWRKVKRNGLDRYHWRLVSDGYTTSAMLVAQMLARQQHTADV